MTDPSGSPVTSESLGFDPANDGMPHVEKEAPKHESFFARLEDDVRSWFEELARKIDHPLPEPKPADSEPKDGMSA